MDDAVEGAGTTPGRDAGASTVRLVGVAVLGLAVGLGTMAYLVRGFVPWFRVDHVVGYHSHGFVRRGLLGTLTSPFVDDLGAVHVSMLVVGLGGAALLLVLLVRVARLLPSDGQRGTLLVGAAVVFAQLGWLLGSTDALLLPLLVGVWLLLRAGRPLWAAPLLVVGGLVHELFLAYGVVLLLAAAASGLLPRRRILVPVLLTSVLGLVLLAAGGYHGTGEEFLALLPAYVPQDWVSVVPRAAPWTGSPGDAIGYVTSWIPGQALGSAALLVATVVACLTVLRRRVGWSVAALVVAPGLALAAVGIDWARWSVWMLVATGLVLALVDRLPELERERVWPTVLVLLVLGPAGDASAFPLWLSVML